MTLVFSNEDVEQLLAIDDYIDAIDGAYREVARDQALIQPREDLYLPFSTDDTAYVFKSMVGLLPCDNLVAVRLNSDIIQWSRRSGQLVKDKLPKAAGQRWVGLVLLFDCASAELIAVLPDGIMQRSRVAATAAVGAKYLALDDPRRLGVYGSGWQAEAAVQAMVSALPSITDAAIWSPTRPHRESFAERCGSWGISARAVSEPKDAAVGSEVVISATNALDPVLRMGWLESGVFVSCVKAQELGRDILENVDRVVLHSRELEPTNRVVGSGGRVLVDTDPVDVLFGLERGAGDVRELLRELADSSDTLPEVVVGKSAGRRSTDERIVLLNSLGNGLQFAAVGRRLLAAAKQFGRGRELPDHWFSENVHP